jgi:hypothetical protein
MTLQAWLSAMHACWEQLTVVLNNCRALQGGRTHMQRLITDDHGDHACLLSCLIEHDVLRSHALSVRRPVRSRPEAPTPL